MILYSEAAAFGYGGPAVIQGLDFTVKAGDYLAIIGENGAGKTTLIRGLLGFLQAQAGNFRKESDCWQNIAYVPQRASLNHDFPATVEEVLLSACLAKRGGLFPRKDDRDRVHDVLEQFEMRAKLKTSFRELSGGQQQRILLARALLSGENLLLLDEPGAGLDPAAMASLRQMICRLHQEQGKTVLMVTHDLAVAEEDASQVLLLSGGQQCFFGSRDEYLNSPLRGFFGTRQLSPQDESSRTKEDEHVSS